MILYFTFLCGRKILANPLNSECRITTTLISAHSNSFSLLVGNGDVIQLNVINGTKWVGLGGNVETFEAVIGRPPMTSSDITLKQALSRINQVISYLQLM